MEDKILFLSASIGQGHDQAARSVAEWLPLVGERIEVTLLDYVQADPIWGRSAKAVYLAALKVAPSLYEFLYHRLQTPRLTKSAGWIMEHSSQSAVSHLLRAFNPKVIVCTHFVPIRALAKLRRKVGSDYKIAVIMTDFAPHSLWCSPDVDRYFVANEEIRAALCDRGVSRDQIVVSGIPIRPSFTQRLDRSPRADRPKILLMGGGLGLGPVEEMVRHLLTEPHGLDLTVLCGRNQELRLALSRLDVPDRHALHIHGFTEQVAEFMSRSDLLITKPGGSTASEALALELPMVLIEPVPGQEAENADYLIRQGAALMAHSGVELRAFIEELLFAQPARLMQMQSAARRASRPYAGKEIATELLHWTSDMPDVGLKEAR